jgi:hypothetical protein
VARRSVKPVTSPRSSPPTPSARMAKRPLTRIAYPRVWVPASPRPLANESPTPFPPTHDPHAALDTLEPTSTPVLLSAEKAKARLREIIEGFFFRRLKGEDGKRIGRLLVKSPPGLGKTREAIDWAIRYQSEQEGKGPRDLRIADQNEAGVPAQTSIFVPRHHLAEELKRVIEGAFHKRGELVRVPILRGRENGGEEGKAPCWRWREAHALARKGLPIYTNLCERRGEGQAFQCPHYAGCEYIQTRRAPSAILVHSHLGLEWGATAAERASWVWDGPADDEDDSAERPRHFNPKQANIIVCDEDPTTSLVEQGSPPRIFRCERSPAHEPPAKADTVPRVRPSPRSPNPNMEPAALPSNGVRGSPAEGR